jgi:hypothetical protein
VPGNRINDQKKDQFCGNRPEHATESHEIQHCADQYQQKVQGSLGKGIDVFGNTLIRVVDLGVAIQFVISPIAEIAVQKMPGQPAPPVNTELVPYIVVKRIDRYGHNQDDEAFPDGRPEPVRVLCRQCRGEFPDQLVEQHGESRLPQQQHHQQDKQPPGLPFFFPEPVGGRYCPEAPPQVMIKADHGLAENIRHPPASAPPNTEKRHK